jgi:hypothetical protein
MNCKPGDMAVIVRSKFAPQLIGRIVEVLHSAPNNRPFRLPNGQSHEPLSGSRFYWVCKFQNQIEAPTDAVYIKTIYAPVPDECLRPIRDQPGDDEMLRITGLPSETKQPELTT